MNQALRAVGSLLPPLPYAVGIFNRILKPILYRPTVGRIRSNVNGLVMDLDPNESVDGALYFHPHLYDRMELRFLREHLHVDSVFVDVGAHIGFYSLMMARSVSSGRVIAIEADPFNAGRLAEHVELNHFEHVVTVVETGVSDSEQTLPLGLQLRGNRSGNSFLVHQDSTTTVRCRPLLAILEDARVARIDAMKMDIEGFECKVLQRFFAEAPRSLWPQAMVIEHFADHPNTGDPIALLGSAGYRVVGRTGMNWMLEAAGSPAELGPRGPQIGRATR